MRDWNPKSLWDELVKTLRGWSEDDDRPSADPNLLFHMLFILPLILGLLVLARRA